MPASLRLTKDEQRVLTKTCVDMNKKLIALEQIPVSESELAHMVLEMALRRVKIDRRGQIVLD